MRSPHDMKPGERYAYRTDEAGWCINYASGRWHLAEDYRKQAGHFRIPDDPAALPVGSRVERISDGVEGVVRDGGYILFGNPKLWMPGGTPGLLVALIALSGEPCGGCDGHGIGVEGSLCRYCAGHGTTPEPQKCERCDVCEGYGCIGIGSEGDEHWKPCPVCGGRGTPKEQDDA